MRTKFFLQHLLSLFIIFVLISSCQKEPGETVAATSCQVIKAYYFDLNGSVEDSLLYTYTNNKLTSASNSFVSIDLEYKQDRVTKRSRYETGFPGMVGFDTVIYNTDGTIAMINSHFEYNGQVAPYQKYEFGYSGGKLSTFDVKYYDPSTAQFELYETTTYTYTGNNVTRSNTITTGSTDIEIFEFGYDNNDNYFAKNNALFADLIFMDGLEGAVLPLLISNNNVTKIITGTDETVLTYSLDSKGNFFELYLDGELGSRYFYQCK